MKEIKNNMDCERLLVERNEARLNWMQKKIRASAEEYRIKRKEAKSICRRKKMEYFNTD